MLREPVLDHLTATAREDLRDLFRALGRQRREQHGVDAAEDRRIAENANRKRQDGDDREARRADERTDGVLEVLTQRGEEREAALSAMGFDGLSDAAEPAKRRVTPLLGRHALAHVLVRRLGDVRVDFGTQLAVTSSAAAEEAEKAREQNTQAGHDPSS